MFPEITSRLRSLLAAPPPLSIFGGPGEEKTVTSFEAITTDWYARNGYNQIYEALGGSGASWSGERVNLASALNHSVVWACNRIIAETVGFIPLVMLQVDKNPAKGKQLATKHPMFQALQNAPNDDMTAMGFRETLTSHCVLQGNAYAQIIRRSGTGVAMELHPLQPSQVRTGRNKAGQLVYVVKTRQRAGENLHRPEEQAAGHLPHARHREQRHGRLLGHFDGAPVHRHRDSGREEPRKLLCPRGPAPVHPGDGAEVQNERGLRPVPGRLGNGVRGRAQSADPRKRHQVQTDRHQPQGLPAPRNAAVLDPRNLPLVRRAAAPGGRSLPRDVLEHRAARSRVREADAVGLAHALGAGTLAMRAHPRREDAELPLAPQPERAAARRLPEPHDGLRDDAPERHRQPGRNPRPRRLEPDRRRHRDRLSHPAQHADAPAGRRAAATAERPGTIHRRPTRPLPTRRIRSRRSRATRSRPKTPSATLRPPKTQEGKTNDAQIASSDDDQISRARWLVHRLARGL